MSDDSDKLVKLIRKISELKDRNTLLIEERDSLRNECNRLEWLIKRETGLWLETRDANQRLQAELERIKNA